ncbi:MAG: flagellar basal body rod protein FlgB [Pseudolabrys sp.]|nr:flagellar basal body rod protein FlgB [Pseudolabrys sp.]
MAITDVPIFSMLRTKMNWNQERQKVLAENVSNSDTPNYRERDLVPPKFREPGVVTARPVAQLTMASTDGAHIAGTTMSGTRFGTESKGNYEIRPTGNSVNLEEEMMKVAANQMDYQAATALYSRSLGLLKTALGKR